MKTKMLLMAALIGAAAISARAGVHFGISIGLPAPVIVTPPVVCAARVAPAPVVVVQTAPVFPRVDYVWVPGYWSVNQTGRVWVPGAWQHRQVRVTQVIVRHNTYERHDGYERNNRHDGHDRNNSPNGRFRGVHRR